MNRQFIVKETMLPIMNRCWTELVIREMTKQKWNTISTHKIGQA